MNPPFAPTIERSDIAMDQIKFITKCSYDKYMDGNFSDIPHITGFTRHETLLFTGSNHYSYLNLINVT